VCMGGLLSKPSKGRRQTRLSVHSGRSVCESPGTRGNLPMSTCAERFFMQRHLPQLPRHTSRPTETNGVTREYERGMMHTPEFRPQSSSWAHAGSRRVVAMHRMGSLYRQIIPWETLDVPPYRRCWTRRLMGGKICCDHLCKCSVAPPTAAQARNTLCIFSISVTITPRQGPDSEHHALMRSSICCST